MIGAFTRCLRPDSRSTVRGGCVINRALVDSMDWDAVRAGWTAEHSDLGRAAKAAIHARVTIFRSGSRDQP